MLTVYLAGGIASGKSTVARLLEGWGARRIDLDQVSRDVLAPGQPCLAAVAQAFGDDLVDPKTGELDRGLLAQRAFASSEGAERLESLELPFIAQGLRDRLDQAQADGASLALVEVPLLDRMGDLMSLADGVLVVACPLALRRVRAQGRGMDPADFDARAARQPSDGFLRDHATWVLDNEGDEAALVAQAQAWWDGLAGQGLLPARGGEG